MIKAEIDQLQEIILSKFNPFNTIFVTDIVLEKMQNQYFSIESKKNKLHYFLKYLDVELKGYNLLFITRKKLHIEKFVQLNSKLKNTIVLFNFIKTDLTYIKIVRQLNQFSKLKLFNIQNNNLPVLNSAQFLENYLNIVNLLSPTHLKNASFSFNLDSDYHNKSLQLIQYEQLTLNRIIPGYELEIHNPNVIEYTKQHNKIGFKKEEFRDKVKFQNNFLENYIV